MEKQPNIEVCLSPELYHLYDREDVNVIIVDILRASSSICTAFMNGVKEIIPVGSISEAKSFKERGFVVAAERDGQVLDFADFGNSPHYFTPEKVQDKIVAYSTTNGTKAIQMTRNSKNIYIGSFLNLSALARELINEKLDIVIFCSGWKKKFNIEDTLFAGALSKQLMDAGIFTNDCDSTIAAIDLWQLAQKDIEAYTKKISWLKRLGMHEVLEYCMQTDITPIIPVFENGKLINRTASNK